MASLAMAVSVAAPAAVADPSSPTPSLQPYTARYQVSYRGLGGGEIESSFRRGAQQGLWQYETRAHPNLFGRLALSSQAHERSMMLVSPGEVRPLSFTFNDGSSDKHKDVQLVYDWAAGRLTGTAEGKPVEIELAPGTQDTASVQAAMIQARLAGHKPKSFRIVTGGKLREYRYWMEGTQQVMTPYGQVEAEVWASARDGSNRVSKVWHAPSLGFVPVQAIQYRKGNPEVQMKLVRLQRPE
ncbi:MAG TPA: DUF3108 domain-containing protein [Steroidobacteraceae bacterium]|nr:DUF3108 domain-containing protein [Steroidobacteraceae bacterium]